METMRCIDEESVRSIVLTDSERDRFLMLLERPPQLNAALKKAMKKYLKKRQQGSRETYTITL